MSVNNSDVILTRPTTWSINFIFSETILSWKHRTNSNLHCRIEKQNAHSVEICLINVSQLTDFSWFLKYFTSINIFKSACNPISEYQPVCTLNKINLFASV